MRPFIKKMQVDEDKEFTLINLAQIKKNKRMVETDHNAIIVDMELYNDNEKPCREEVFNLKSKSGQEAFFKETEENEDLLNSFKDNLSINIQSLRWKKIFTDILHKCFRKVRVIKKKSTIKIDDMLKERVKLKKELKSNNINEEMKLKIENKIKELEENIGEDVINENHKEILDTVKELGDGHEFNSLERRQLWKVLKRKYPKNLNAVPVGKKNSNGEIVTRHKELKILYLNTYTQRLRNRPIKKEFKEIKDIK